MVHTLVLPANIDPTIICAQQDCPRKQRHHVGDHGCGYLESPDHAGLVRKNRCNSVDCAYSARRHHRPGASKHCRFLAPRNGRVIWR
ncbi:hypothetical protein KBX50_08260 [Micromonospora sp. C51]|uniref:hypothetical protein n=1 Tax=Micromonospora sp. C51 TaxID=2824879 RepID=UPI001B37C80E|nr:hypothetical protein [Micromonospora sp. C51]MBQ1048457.1 hypothetical protein [Micromonospora sp. C51]